MKPQALIKRTTWLATLQALRNALGMSTGSRTAIERHADGGAQIERAGIDRYHVPWQCRMEGPWLIVTPGMLIMDRCYVFDEIVVLGPMPTDVDWLLMLRVDVRGVSREVTLENDAIVAQRWLELTAAPRLVVVQAALLNGSANSLIAEIDSNSRHTFYHPVAMGRNDHVSGHNLPFRRFLTMQPLINDLSADIHQAELQLNA